MVDKKINSNAILTVAIIATILAFSAYILLKDNGPSQITEELAICIGQKADLYVQTGCVYCKTQEDLFGEYIGYLNIIDCFEDVNRQRCIIAGIEGTPTWVINGEKYSGVRKINELKKLTRC